MNQTVSSETFFTWFKSQWRQGEHVAVIGPTGTGKTTIATRILPIRDYVAVIAVKRKDETVDKFKKQGFAVIEKWPPDWSIHKCVLWIKPKSLEIKDLEAQADEIHKAVSSMYIAGGWCIDFDEAGYLAGELGLGHAIGVLLNQGRSSHISVVSCMTRPTSLVARVPKEALTQPRHRFVFRYENEDEIKACAKICDMSPRELAKHMNNLATSSQGGHTDFMYIGKGYKLIIKNS